MTTTVRYSERLDARLVEVYDAGDVIDGEPIYREHRMLVVDNVPWSAALDTVRASLIPRPRKMKAPFVDTPPSAETLAAVDRLGEEATALFARLFPTFKYFGVRTYYRPMITGPEPMHYDTYGGSIPLVTSYLNVSTEPRRYAIGYNFPTLLALYSDQVKKILAGCNGDSQRLTYELRELAAKGHGPFGKGSPRHEVELAPGTIWFFNAKTVSHEVIYGAGAIGVAWECPQHAGPSQDELLKGAGL